MADFRHFMLAGSRAAQRYTTPPAGGAQHRSPPRPDRKTHGDKLLDDLARAEKVAVARQQSELIREGLHFIPMRFGESPNFELELKKLAGNEEKGIRIVSARERAGRKEYVVAVTDSQVPKLANKFRAYRDENTRTGKPKNEPLASSIAEIDAAELADYWTEPDEQLPPADQAIWWEMCPGSP